MIKMSHPLILTMQKIHSLKIPDLSDKLLIQVHRAITSLICLLHMRKECTSPWDLEDIHPTLDLWDP